MWIDIASGGLLLLHLLVLHPTLKRELQISVGHCRTSTASARFQWALPGPNCDRGSQWAQPDTTSARSQWALPLPYQMGGGPSQLGRAFADLSRSFREAFADFGSHLSKFVNNVSVWIQIHLRKLSTNILKTRILSLESLFRELSRKEIFAKAFADLSRTWF